VSKEDKKTLQIYLVNPRGRANCTPPYFEQYGNNRVQFFICSSVVL